MYDKTPLTKITIPITLPPLLKYILDEWRGFYPRCKTRRLQITIAPDELELLRALADGFYRKFRDDARVTWDDETYRVWSSVVVQGSTQSFRFPVDLFLAESHAEVLPDLARRVRTRPDLDEGTALDQIAYALDQITVLLKKNDVRLLQLLCEPHALEPYHFLFPADNQLARTLGTTEPTIQSRLSRLLQAQVLQPHYWVNPRSLEFALAITEHPWPGSPRDRSQQMVAFETAPEQGVSVVLQQLSGDELATPHWPVHEFLYATNLDQLAQWNQLSWTAYPPVVGATEEEPVTSTGSSIDLTQSPTPALTSLDVRLIHLLQTTAGRDAALLERETGLSTADLQTQIRGLVAAPHCLPLMAIRRIGLHNRLFVYLDGPAAQVQAFRENLLLLPQVALFVSEDRLVAVVLLPDHWVYRFATDLERLKLAGWRLFYRVWTPTSSCDLRKSITVFTSALAEDKGEFQAE
jgi:hypothetical protein